MNSPIERSAIANIFHGMCPFRLRVAAFGAIAATLLVQSTGHTAGNPTDTRTEPEVRFGSAYCGPRCVQRVLREYGKEVELVDLIREMQWPSDEKGSSLDSLATAFAKRGIHTKAVDLDPAADIEWTHAAIVHLNPDYSRLAQMNGLVVRRSC